MTFDINAKEFDDGTLIKLNILRQYLRKWLPVFIKHSTIQWKEIGIYDLFAGAGTDVVGAQGSPVIILEELSCYCKEIVLRKLDITVIFNEVIKTKAKKLEACCEAKLNGCRLAAAETKTCPVIETKKESCCFKVIYAKEDFQNLFRKLEPKLLQLDNAPQFMFLDQYGIKHITKDVFAKIVNLKRTDFMFYISSSFISRFIELPEFQAYIKLSKESFQENEPTNCHRIICEYYRSLVPKGKEYFIAPFSIKKGKNIYGLIFGSNHLLGLKKFLEVAWNIDKNTGEANFNIDNDRIVKNDQLSMFPEENIVKKLDLYRHDLTNYLKIKPQSNMDVNKFSLLHGFLSKHTHEILIEIEKEGHILVVSANQNIKRQRGAFYLNDTQNKLFLSYKE